MDNSTHFQFLLEDIHSVVLKEMYEKRVRYSSNSVYFQISTDRMSAV